MYLFKGKMHLYSTAQIKKTLIKGSYINKKIV